MKTNFHSLNSTYNVCALKNLQFRFQEKNLILNRDSNLGSPGPAVSQMHTCKKERQASNLEIRGSNPGSGSNFSLEIQNVLFKNTFHLVHSLKDMKEAENLLQEGKMQMCAWRC